MSSTDLRRIGGQALVEVLDTLLSLPATEVTPGRKACGRETDQRILATVKLIGEQITGEIHLQIPEAFAQQTMNLLRGKNDVSPVSDAEADDLSGELGNMIAGRVATHVGREGYACELSTPTVVRGSSVRLEPESGEKGGRTDWSCRGHWLTLTISCRIPPA